MMSRSLQPPPEQLAAFCRHWRISRLWVFGSALRSDFRQDSDVDVLVEFDSGAGVGYLELEWIAEGLSPLFGGRRIDLVTVPSLSPHLRDRVLASASARYAA